MRGSHICHPLFLSLLRPGRGGQPPHLGRSDESFLKGLQEDLPTEQAVSCLAHVCWPSSDPGHPGTVPEGVCCLHRGAPSKDTHLNFCPRAAPLWRVPAELGSSLFPAGKCKGNVGNVGNGLRSHPRPARPQPRRTSAPFAGVLEEMRPLAPSGCLWVHFSNKTPTHMSLSQALLLGEPKLRHLHFRGSPRGHEDKEELRFWGPRLLLSPGWGTPRGQRGKL